MLFGAFGWVLIAVIVGVVVLMAERTNEIACLSVRNGKVLLVRGAVPSGLVSDVADVAGRARIGRATIRLVRAAHGARVVASGVDEATAQRLRNVLGTYSISALRSASPLRKRNVGQLLGIAWIAWLLTDRRA